MEDLFGINSRRRTVEENIQKSFIDNDLEKARSGVYSDTPENRKLGRVGQQYGGKKQPELKTKRSGEKKNVNSEKLTNDEKKEINVLVNKFRRKHSEGAVALERTEEGKSIISKLKGYGVEKVGKYFQQKYDNAPSEGGGSWYYTIGRLVMGEKEWKQFLKKIWDSKKHKEYDWKRGEYI